MKLPPQPPAEAKDCVRVWRFILSQWLLWQDDRIQKFVQRWETSMSDESHLFYHELPFYYIAPLLLSPSMRKRFEGGERVSLCREMEVAFINFDSFAFLRPGFDWAAARQRVEQVLAKHGGTLPKPEDLAWYEDEERAA
jgi:hypothetical protein